MAVGGPNILLAATGSAVASAQTMQVGIIAAGQCASGDNAVLTVGSGKSVKIGTFSLTNVAVTATAVVVQVVPTGGGIGATHVITPSFSIPAGDTISHEDVLAALKGIALAAGDVISVNAAAGSAVNYLITGTQTA